MGGTVALSNRQWGLSAALGMVLLAAAYLPPAEVRSRFRLEWEAGAPADRRYLVSRGHLTAALEETALAAEIAGLRTGRIPFTAADQGVSTELLGSSSPRVADDLHARVVALWNRFPQVDSSLRLRIVGWQTGAQASPDPDGADPHPDRFRVVLPEETDGRTCLLLLPSVWVEDTSRMQAVEVRGLGPCALHAAFGPPGVAVGRWFRQTDYDLAGETSWATGDSAPSYRWWSGQRSSSPAMQQLYQLVAPLFGAVNPAYEGGVGSAACAAGAAEACRRVLLDSMFRHDPTVPRASPGVVLTQRTYFGGDGRIGPVSGRWASDLIREQGRERFATFWRSAAPPDSAFRSAYGRSMEDWTTAWMRDQYGEVTSGAGLTLWSALSALCAAGLTLVFAALVSHFRTVD